MRRMTQRVGLVVSLCLLAVCLGLLGAWVVFLRTPLVKVDQGVRYTVADGASINSVIHDLYLLDIIKHPRFFELLVFLRHDRHQLKAGEYLFPKGLRPNALLTQITSGSGMLFHSFSIVAGWNFAHLRRALNNDSDFTHTSETLSNVKIMQRLGAPTLNPEGWFFPDTYLFVKGTSDMVILKKAFKLMQKNLQSAWHGREAGLPFSTPAQALTAASLVEKETSLANERPIIAGVLINRLRKNMLLQFDPTVIYAAGTHFNGTITRENLLHKSPYNTYVTKGLPPTPIAIPGLNSILAVMHPAHHNYLYFVAKNYDMNGPSRFSATWAEQKKAIARAKQGRSHTEFFNDDVVRYHLSRQFLPLIFDK